MALVLKLRYFEEKMEMLLYGPPALSLLCLSLPSQPSAPSVPSNELYYMLCGGHVFC